MDWRPGTAVGRWSTLGPYYAMFPVGFVRTAVEAWCPAGAAVLDPFCGRGTVPYVARATGRESLGIDLNPVAWVFAAAKTDPEPELGAVLRRIAETAAGARPGDAEPENDFQAWAWAPRALAFLRSARRDLDWRGDRTDRTVMAIALAHLHGRGNNGVGNQMPGHRSVSPGYAVRWWASQGMRPPDRDPAAFLAAKARWRYRHGTPPAPGGAAAEIALGDAREGLAAAAARGRRFGLLLTSPPYFDVTDYRLNTWIRLWMLGGPPLPTFEKSHRHADRASYAALLLDTFAAAAAVLDGAAAAWVRTDARPLTRDLTAAALAAALPGRPILARAERPARSQTRLLGDAGEKPGEIDLLVPPPGGRAPEGFAPAPPEWQRQNA